LDKDISLLVCLVSVSMVTQAQYNKPTCIKSITNHWLKALCHTLDFHEYGGRCTGNSKTFDCSCKVTRFARMLVNCFIAGFCRPLGGGPACAKYKCEVGGWLCQEQCREERN
jgi:hypothetical protein